MDFHAAIKAASPFTRMDTVLVVEDDEALRATLVYNLKSQGFSAEAVGDGLAALETARRLRPNLILLDLMLPRLMASRFAASYDKRCIFLF